MMRCMSWLLLAIALPFSAWAGEWLSPEEAALWLKGKQHMHIVDVRDSESYRKATLKGAVNLSVEQLRGMQVEPKAHILLIADKRIDVRQLPEGYAEIKLLRFDLSSWKRAGLHAVRIKIKPAFVIPKGLCEMNPPADEHEEEIVEEPLW